MQTKVEDFCVKRYTLLTDKFDKKLEDFAGLAHEEAESTTFKVIENHADRVIGRIQTLTE